MKPEFEDETPVNPFDFWEGRNLKLKIRQVEGFRNYDKSEFESVDSVVADTDEAIEAIWSQQHSLAEIVDPKNFKSYDELKKKLDMVLGSTRTVPSASSVSVQTGDAADDLFVESNTAKAPTSSEDESAMSYFAKLAEDN